MFARKGNENATSTAIIYADNLKGPFEPAVFRFQIAFGSDFPLAAPIITFASDPFHPLISPLTTATFSSGLADGEAGGSGNEQRLPPGGLSLRHGFPQWFGRHTTNAEADGEEPSQSLRQSLENIHVIDLLLYVRSCFEDEGVLDALPMEAAGNPSAWYAWRSHRDKMDPKAKIAISDDSSSSTQDTMESSTPSGARPTHGRQQSVTRPRRPSQWNWEGVWQERVKKVIQNTLSEPSLFGGNASRDEEIHFVKNQEDELDSIRADMHQHLRILD